MYQTLEYSKQA